MPTSYSDRLPSAWSLEAVRESASTVGERSGGGWTTQSLWESVPQNGLTGFSTAWDWKSTLVVEGSKGTS